jgi:hypothetical protein
MPLEFGFPLFPQLMIVSTVREATTALITYLLPPFQFLHLRPPLSSLPRMLGPLHLALVETGQKFISGSRVKSDLLDYNGLYPSALRWRRHVAFV